MPRIANSTDALLADLQSRLTRLVETARKEGREEALADVRAVVGGSAGSGGGSPGGAKRGRKPRAAAPAAKKPKKKRKNPWATMTPAQKKERVRKMLAGRGLKPKGER